jgi:hypothetical protein
MREMRYALLFLGCVTRSPSSRGVLRLTMTARSSSFLTVIGPQGVRSSVHHVAAEAAKFEATVQTVDGTTFCGSGMIAFGENGHWLRFSTRAAGRLSASPDPARQQGLVTWQVDGGTGQFAAAQGVIASLFMVEQDGHVVDNQVAVLFLP